MNFDACFGVVLNCQEKRQKAFDDLKAEIFKRQLSNAENFDRSILTYSTAGLAFSLAFLKDFIPITQAALAFLLYFSWLLFTLAIVFTISSYISSQAGLKKQMCLAERYYLNNETKAFDEKNCFVAATDWLSRIAGFCFVIAIILTAVFVSINLERTTKMSEQKKFPVPLREGAPIPPLQQIPQEQPQQSQQQQPAQDNSPKGGGKSNP